MKKDFQLARINCQYKYNDVSKIKTIYQNVSKY